MSTQAVRVATDLPEWSQFLFEPARYKVVYGGRGATKTARWGVIVGLVVPPSTGPPTMRVTGRLNAS